MVWACGKNGWVPYGERMLMTEVSGGRVRRRPRLDFMDGVKVALGSDNERKIGKSGDPWSICN